MVFSNNMSVGNQGFVAQNYLNLIQNPVLQQAPIVVGAILPVSYYEFGATLLATDDNIRTLSFEAKAEYIWNHWIALGSVAVQSLGLGGTGQSAMNNANINPMQRTGT